MKRPFSTVAAAILTTALLPILLSATSAVIPAGTRIDVRLTTTISTSANQDGDPFIAEVEAPMFAHGEEIVQAGSTLHGHITFVKPPGRVKGKAEMRLVADDIVTKHRKEYSFKAELASDSGVAGAKVKGSEGTVQGAGKSVKSGAEETGIGAAAGAGAGAIAAGGTGALYGAGIGALAGVVHTLAKHHKDLVLHPGTELTFVLSTPARESKFKPGSEPSAPFLCANCR